MSVTADTEFLDELLAALDEPDWTDKLSATDKLRYDVLATAPSIGLTDNDVTVNGRPAHVLVVDLDGRTAPVAVLLTDADVVQFPED